MRQTSKQLNSHHTTGYFLFDHPEYPIVTSTHGLLGKPLTAKPAPKMIQGLWDRANRKSDNNLYPQWVESKKQYPGYFIKLPKDES